MGIQENLYHVGVVFKLIAGYCSFPLNYKLSSERKWEKDCNSMDYRRVPLKDAFSTVSKLGLHYHKVVAAICFEIIYMEGVNFEKDA